MARTDILSGTFTAAGASEAVQLYTSVDLSLKMSAGKVTLQRLVQEEWRTVKTWTASDVPSGHDSIEDAIYPGRSGRAYRLNCTEYTSDIEYFLG